MHCVQAWPFLCSFENGIYSGRGQDIKGYGYNEVEMVRGASSFPPFNPVLLKQFVGGGPRNLFVRGYARIKTVFRASLYGKEVLAIFQLLCRRLLHNKGKHAKWIKS